MPNRDFDPDAAHQRHCETVSLFRELIRYEVIVIVEIFPMDVRGAIHQRFYLRR